MQIESLIITDPEKVKNWIINHNLGISGFIASKVSTSEKNYQYLR